MDIIKQVYEINTGSLFLFISQININYIVGEVPGGDYCSCCKKEYKNIKKHLNTYKHQYNLHERFINKFCSMTSGLVMPSANDFILQSLTKEKYISKIIMEMKFEMEFHDILNREKELDNQSYTDCTSRDYKEMKIITILKHEYLLLYNPEYQLPIEYFNALINFKIYKFGFKKVGLINQYQR